MRPTPCHIRLICGVPPPVVRYGDLPMLKRFFAASSLALATLAAGEPPPPPPPAEPPASEWVDNAAEAAKTLATRARIGEKTLIVWIFDQSKSMEDDREALAKQVDNLLKQLMKQVKEKENLLMAVYGVGAKAIEVQSPTNDKKLVAQAIRSITVDASGKETPMKAILSVLAKYKQEPSYRENPPQMIIVLVTDEAGDDASLVDEVEKELLDQKAQFFCIGAEAGFQMTTMNKRVRYMADNQQLEAPVKLSVGPESESVEIAAALPERVIVKKREKMPPGGIGPMGMGSNRVSNVPEDLKIPSGFGFYAPARLAANSGGAYLVVPDPEPSKVPIDREKMQAHYQPSYAPDRLPETDYGRKVRIVLEEVKQSRGRHVGCLCGPVPPDEETVFGCMAQQAQEYVKGLLAASRQEITEIEACEAKIHESIGDIRKRKKKTYWTDEAEGRQNARWEANAMLVLTVLGAERDRLAQRVRLLQQEFDGGRFANAAALDPKTSCKITFTMTSGKPHYEVSNHRPYPVGDELESAMDDSHGGTPWAWHAEAVKKAVGTETIRVEFKAPPQPPKPIKMPPPPKPPPGPSGY